MPPQLEYESPVLLPLDQVNSLRDNIRDQLRPITDYIDLSPEYREVDLLDDYIEDVEDILQDLQCYREVIVYSTWSAMRIEVEHLRDRLERIEQASTGAGVIAPRTGWKVRTGVSGRPRWEVDEDFLVEMVYAAFSRTEMAKRIGCSVSTVKRMLRSINVYLRQFTNIADEDLCAAIIRCQRTPGMGIKGVMSSLRVQENILVPRRRVRECLRIIDPAGPAMRFGCTIKRRRYYVPYINSLWHIDGNHKLIEYRIIFHCGIDGKSRMVTFAQASSNNQAATMALAFEKGMWQYGVPSRVRADCGVEMQGVKARMDQLRGPQRRNRRDASTFIEGRSVHNQRIERWWRDLRQWMTETYEVLFMHLQLEGHLNTDNMIHLWCLHFVFLEQINADLELMRQTWNFHSVRTEGGATPEVMWRRCILEAADTGLNLRVNPTAIVDDDHPWLQRYYRQGWQTYGFEGISAQSQRAAEKRSYVEVVEPHKGMPEWLSEILLEEEFQEWLEGITGPYDLNADDLGANRCVRCLQEVRQYLATYHDFHDV